jgi:hypothetical protein
MPLKSRINGTNDGRWAEDLAPLRDECVTIKNPANHMLVEQIYCNWSGGMSSKSGDQLVSSCNTDCVPGCAMGSLGAEIVGKRRNRPAGADRLSII